MENMQDESCPICLVDYEAEDELRNLPCDHAFHKAVNPVQNAHPVALVRRPPLAPSREIYPKSVPARGVESKV